VDDVEAPSQECGDVFHEDESGSKVANGVGDRSPEAGAGAGDAFAFAGIGDVLAGEAGGDDVDRRDRGPVDGADVAEVVHAGEAVGEDGSGVPVGFGVPGEVSAEDGVHGEVEAAVSGAQRPDPRRSDARRSDARRSDARRSDARRSDARRSDARRSDARRSDARRSDAR